MKDGKELEKKNEEDDIKENDNINEFVENNNLFNNEIIENNEKSSESQLTNFDLFNENSDFKKLIRKNKKIK